ncbi:hypothetical protein Goshw_028140 [Gossypium schwendimanii]|uniref:Uncharacterized protein n=1 Tax=Gossypium schwendimanii TaxID=34291 RepID=A0A7J9KNP3_GOSSC|nr:hypothetical protein [Gossypium schwendimanii]
MTNILKESNTKKIVKKRTNEFLSQLKGGEDKHEGFIDEVSVRQATRENIEYYGERTNKSIQSESKFTFSELYLIG